MSTAKWLVSLLVIFSALVIQLVMVNGLALPLSVPDLVAVSVICLAVSSGAFQGLILGFFGGLAVDLTSDHAVGRYALVLSLVGYAIGHMSDEAERSTLVPLAAVAMGSVGTVLGYAVTGLFTGDPRLGAVDLPAVLGGRVLYDVVLTPFIYPVLRGLLVKFEPARS